MACSSEDADPASQATKSPPPRPNVLLYVVDTLRADGLSTYGNKQVSTPQLDAIAGQGVLFENAQANASWTRASMASLFTGLYPPRHGTRTRADRLEQDIPIISQTFLEAGYATGYIVANPNVGGVFGFERGFSDVIELYQRRKPGFVNATELIATADTAIDKAIGWIDGTQGPFFLTLMPIDPHAPYDPPEGYDLFGTKYVGTVDGSAKSLHRPNLTPADKFRLRSLYHGEIAFTDATFGRMIEYLRERELLDDTIIVFTSDHGEEFWEYGRAGHGSSLADTLLRVPLFIRYPRDSRIVAGTRKKDAVELVDVFPSVLDLAGLPIPEQLDGRSLWSTDEPSTSQTFSELSLGRRHMSAIREYPWKLIVDHKKKTSHLYSLRRPKKEARPLDLIRNAAARATHDRLSAKLTLITESERAAAAPESDVDVEVPEDIEDALRELGYVE